MLAANQADCTQTSAQTVRIATWNILHGIDFRRGGVDLGAVAAGIAALDADVVALQEVDFLQPRSGEVAQADQLGRQLGYFSVFAPSLSGDPGRGWTEAERASQGPGYGVALLSRHPIGRWRRIRLPGGGAHQRGRAPHPTRLGWDHEPRVALQAQLSAGASVVHVTVTHLSYMPWRSVRQLRTVLAAQGTAAPAVILGDFNLPPQVVNSLAAGWRSAGGEATYPASQPRLQLDQILVRGLDVTAVHVAPQDCSDHLALVAEVTLPANP